MWDYLPPAREWTGNRNVLLIRCYSANHATFLHGLGHWMEWSEVCWIRQANGREVSSRSKGSYYSRYLQGWFSFYCSCLLTSIYEDWPSRRFKYPAVSESHCSTSLSIQKQMNQSRVSQTAQGWASLLNTQLIEGRCLGTRYNGTVGALMDFPVFTRQWGTRASLYGGLGWRTGSVTITFNLTWSKPQWRLCFWSW